MDAMGPMIVCMCLSWLTSQTNSTTCQMLLKYLEGSTVDSWQHIDNMSWLHCACIKRV